MLHSSHINNILADKASNQTYCKMRIAHKYFAVLLVTFGLFWTGCDSNESDPDPIVTGTYSDVISLSGLAVNFQMTFSETDGSVSGNGTMGVPAGSVALTASGTHNHPSISLTFSSTGFTDFNLSGTVSEDGDRITGTLSGSELDGVTVALDKE
jgi:hypothetical protein